MSNANGQSGGWAESILGKGSDAVGSVEQSLASNRPKRLSSAAVSGSPEPFLSSPTACGTLLDGGGLAGQHIVLVLSIGNPRVKAWMAQGNCPISDDS